MTLPADPEAIARARADLHRMATAEHKRLREALAALEAGEWTRAAYYVPSLRHLELLAREIAEANERAAA